MAGDDDGGLLAGEGPLRELGHPLPPVALQRLVAVVPLPVQVLMGGGRQGRGRGTEGCSRQPPPPSPTLYPSLPAESPGDRTRTPSPTQALVGGSNISKRGIGIRVEGGWLTGRGGSPSADLWHTKQRHGV